MTKEEITIPRWQDTLRIQYNINLDKKTGETCQDRNIKESLNGVRKLLKGEELTGGERLERLQPSLPSNLDEAAEEYLSKKYSHVTLMDEDDRAVIEDFKAGAEWRDAEVQRYFQTQIEQELKRLEDPSYQGPEKDVEIAAELWALDNIQETEHRDVTKAFCSGAEWATNELFENNRLKDCEALSEEDYKLESDFVDAHIKENHRLPTFLDAIKYGAKWMAEQGETLEGEVVKDINNQLAVTAKGFSGTESKFGDKVTVQVRKK